MKNRILTLMFFSLLSVIVVSGQNSNKNNPIGTWKFDAPYAPEGYSSGKIVVGLNNQKPTTTMSFTGSDSILVGENVKTVNDSVLFTVYLEGQDIKVLLKVENDTNMSGKAVYSEGEVPLTLSKILSSEAAVKK
jgi:hypothetical protein